MMPAMHARERLRWLPGAALAASFAVVALTGCGGSNGGSTSTSATATGSSAATDCRAADLRLRLGHGSAAAGHELAPFSLRNASRHPCGLRGFPRVVLLNRSGQPMNVTVAPRSLDFFGHIAVRQVAVPAGDVASFRLAVSTGINGGDCPTAHSMRVTLPEGSGAISFVLGNILACPGGVSVSPFAPDHAAFR